MLDEGGEGMEQQISRFIERYVPDWYFTVVNPIDLIEVLILTFWIY